MDKTQKTQEAMNADHKRLLARLKLSYAWVLLFGYLVFGIYLFAVKPGATDAQRLYASTVLTAIAVGKKQDKPEKE